MPNSEYSDFYDRARLELTWKINLFMAVILPLLGLGLYLFEQNVAYPTFAGAGVVWIFLYLLYINRSYNFVAIMFALIGTFMCQFTLHWFPEEYHFVDTLWIIIITLYTYFTLGKIWGTVILMLNIAGAIVWAATGLNRTIDLISFQTNEMIIGLSINLLICGVLIAFLIYQFLKTNQHAEEKYRVLTTELHAKNEEVRTQNKEKTVMLKEIHHRVKNNLQVITSLLRLQSREIKDAKSKEYFEDATQRILAMALIHEKMYQSETLSKIDLAAYLRTLAEELIDSYTVNKPIELSVNCEIEYIQPKSLVSFALMFNELISNSLKHAFTDVKKGEIKIDIRQSGENEISCKYHDNGSWKPPQKEGSFGIELIEDLCYQLDGRFTRKTGEGTTYNFVFEYVNLEE